MGGEAVTQQMWMQVARCALQAGPACDAYLDRARVDPRPAAADEERGLPARGQVGAYSHPALDGFAGLDAHRHAPGLGSLAQHAELALDHVDVADVDRDQLGKPQAGGVEQLDHGLIADREQIIVDRMVQQAA